MKIDLHIHTKTGSDGNLSIEEVFKEAKKRNLDIPDYVAEQFGR